MAEEDYSDLMEDYPLPNRIPVPHSSLSNASGGGGRNRVVHSPVEGSTSPFRFLAQKSQSVSAQLSSAAATDDGGGPSSSPPRPLSPDEMRLRSLPARRKQTSLSKISRTGAAVMAIPGRRPTPTASRNASVASSNRFSPFDPPATAASVAVQQQQQIDPRTKLQAILKTISSPEW